MGVGPGEEAVGHVYGRYITIPRGALGVAGISDSLLTSRVGRERLFLA